LETKSPENSLDVYSANQNARNESLSSSSPPESTRTEKSLTDILIIIMASLRLIMKPSLLARSSIPTPMLSRQFQTGISYFRAVS
jgi:hypothetical protein